MTPRSPQIHFYFDFLSPYAYYARHRLVQLAAQYGAHIVYLPGDLKRLKLAAGNTGPATVQMPRKLDYALQDFKRWGSRYGIAAATIPACGDVRDLNVGTFHAVAEGRAERYVELGFAKVWGQGGARQAPDTMFQEVAQGAGLALAALQQYVASDEAQKAYDAVFVQAEAQGVFGVPTMVIDGELWWGNDRLFMVEERLRQLTAAAAVAA